MASMQIDVDDGIAVVRYEVIGERLFWNAVIRRRDQLLGCSIGGNTALPADAAPATVLRPAVIKAVASASGPSTEIPVWWKSESTR